MATAPPRTLVLIDIENLAGTPAPTTAHCENIRRHLDTLIAGTGPVLAVVACSHFAAPIASFGWPGARRIWRSGDNGADLALLDVIENEDVAGRFTHVILGTGDGIFTEAVAALGARGVNVEVFSRPESLSKRLRLAAASVTLVHCDEVITGADVA